MMEFSAADSLAKQIENGVRDEVHRGLSEYCAATTINYLIHDFPDLYFESPMNEHLLGITLVDRDVTVTVNSNIWYRPRKLFTQAHELCHVLLDKQYLGKTRTVTFPVQKE